MKINGLVAATFAPYLPDGSLNLAMVPQLVEKLVSEGISGIFVCGTNGEGPNLTIAERMALTEAYVKAARKRIYILAHVGHTAIAESRALAAHAAEVGADAISAVAAFYFKPTSVEILADSMAQIAAGAPGLPFYYYHIPAITGVGMDMLEFLRLSEEKIPTLAGIKYTASTLHELQACINYKNGKYEIFSGYDEMLLPALSVGAVSAVGSTYTFAAPVYMQVLRLFQQNKVKEAAEMQLKAVQFIACITKYHPIAAQRAIMKMVGFDLGTARLPLTELNAAQYTQLEENLKQVGFFNLLAKAGSLA